MTEDVKTELPENTGQQIQEAAESQLSEDSEKDSTEQVTDSETKDTTIDDLPLPEPDDEAGEEDKEKPVRPRSKEERLLFKKERELARERARLQEVEARMRQSQQPEIKPAPADFKGMERDNYESEADWVAAVTDKRLQQRQDEMRQQYEMQQAHKRQSEFVAKVNDAKDKGAAKYSDFDQVVEPMFDPYGDFPRNEPLAAAIADSDFAEDILYFMGKYKDKAREIALLPPVKAIKAIANLEQRFKEKRKNAPAKPGAKILEPLKGGKPQTAGTLHGMTPEQIEKMDMKEFKERWSREYGKKNHY